MTTAFKHPKTTEDATIKHRVWQAFVASSIGKAHIDSGLPNQDRAGVWQDTRVTVAVVCDGAGSATHSEQGADYFCQAVGQALFAIGQGLVDNNAAQARQAVSQTVLERLSHIRDQLAQQMVAGQSLRDFHTTLTAVLLVADTALLVQIGDSPLMASRFVPRATDTGQNPAAQVDYFSDLQVLAGENGEYVNETQFITQADWQNQLTLRWLDISAVDLLALMSDGCGDLVFMGASTQTQVYRPFFGNVVFNLCASTSRADGEAMLQDALASPATYRLTGDDKSLVVLLRQPERYRGITPISATVSANSAKTPPTSAAPSASASTINRAPVSALPADSVITAATKQRRNVAVVASVAVLAGLGALLWNADHRQNEVAPKIANSNPSTQPRPALPVMTTATKSFAPTQPLAMWQTLPPQGLHQRGIIQSWTLQFIIDDSTDQNLSASVVQPVAGQTAQSAIEPKPTSAVQASNAAPPSLAAKILPWHTLSLSNDDIKLTYDIACHEVTPAENQTLARVGVPLPDVTSDHRRRYCRLMLQPTQAIAAGDARALVLPHGVGEVLTPNYLGTSRVWYLPPSFDITQAHVPASAAVSQPVAQ